MRERFLLRKLKQFGRKFGLNLINASSPAALFVELMKYRAGGEAEHKSREHEFMAYVSRNLNSSKAQLCQDLLVLFLTKEKRNGYFVEFGATNGVTLSNSNLLETHWGWSGILAEPARGWHEELKRNRRCQIETQCVWSKTGERLEFNEVIEGELSTINQFSGSDGHSAARKQGQQYAVDTISLNDLLEKYNAPFDIDYMSVDTEGSEFTILSNFDFSKRSIRIITVEHNFTAERERINSLLVSKGYQRFFEDFSQWDDWYIKEK